MVFEKIISVLTGGPFKALIDKFVPDANLKRELIAEMEKEYNRAAEELVRLSLKEQEQLLADLDSARKMQMAALQQDDKFSKRYLYYLASFVIFCVFVFDIFMFFIHYPPENRDMINQVSGILNATALVMVLSFFFGSSKSSSDKTEIIKKLS